MNQIRNFYEIRRDGKTITEGMSVEDVGALGETCRVVEVHWTDSLTQRPALLKSSFGVSASIVQGGQFLAAILCSNDADRRLVVVDPNGSIRLTVSPSQLIDGKSQIGVFDWVDAAYSPGDGIFGAIFRVDRFPITQYWMDIDAATGSTLGCRWMR